MPSYVRPSNSRPAFFFCTPPHCLKKVRLSQPGASNWKLNLDASHPPGSSIGISTAGPITSSPFFSNDAKTDEQREKCFEEVTLRFPVDRFKSNTDEILGILPATATDEELSERRQILGQAFLQAKRRDASEKARVCSQPF
jgi:hypothetical protein